MSAFDYFVLFYQKEVIVDLNGDWYIYIYIYILYIISNLISNTIYKSKNFALQLRLCCHIGKKKNLSFNHIYN